MSRIGKSPVVIPQGVTVDVKDNLITVKGKLGELSQEYSDVTVKVEDGHIILERPSDSKDHTAKHGLYRSLINNMVEGVSKGWSKKLGIGWCGLPREHARTKIGFGSRLLSQHRSGYCSRSES